jgi:hypothetical protein
MRFRILLSEVFFVEKLLLFLFILFPFLLVILSLSGVGLAILLLVLRVVLFRRKAKESDKLRESFS